MWAVEAPLGHLLVPGPACAGRARRSGQRHCGCSGRGGVVPSASREPLTAGLYRTRRLPARLALRSRRRAFLSERSMAESIANVPVTQRNAVDNTKAISSSVPIATF